MMPQISKEELVLRLERAIEAEVGLKGLNTLLYGWKKFRHYGTRYLDALKHREWLYIVEVADLSDYAGYDLTKSECAHFCEAE